MADARSGHEYMVEARGLTKAFPARRSWLGLRTRGTTVAVDHVDLALRDGEIMGLVGPNGAGKTTLIKLLTTLLRPTSGRASIAGLDVVADEHRVRRIVGLVTSNERSFYWRLTARQNLRFFAHLYDLPRREARLWIEELLELLDLKDRGDDRFDGYSTGMKQRLAFARGLLGKPRFLFMDEPTKGVDPIAAAALIALLRDRIVDRWRPTVLITSHNLSEIERLCGRIALMHRGRILALGSLDELRALAEPVHRFRLRVRNLQEHELRTLASSARAVEPIRVAPVNGSVDVQVEFAHGSDGFARFVRGIVEGRGDVETCTAMADSFDDVFHKLVTESEPREGPDEGPR